MRVHKGPGKQFFWGFNFVFFTALLVISYAAASSDALVSGFVNLLYGSGYVSRAGSRFCEILFNLFFSYSRDFLLGYLLAQAVSYWLQRTENGYKTALIVCIAAEILMELIRMAVTAQHILAPWDFAAEIIGTVTAMIVILIHERRFV